MGIYDPPTEPPDDPYAPRCERCKQDPCECCNRCGAAPDQACEPECGFDDRPVFDDQERRNRDQ